jgi:dsRNA-specific ribonuclease
MQQPKREFYKKVNDQSPIRRGVRGPEFKDFISRMVARGKLTEKYIDILSSDESMRVYEIAFTSASADPDNSYEILELLGDVTCNRSLLWYFQRKFFPNLSSKENVKILARMKIVYASKNVFSPIALRAGFLKFISAREEDFKYNFKSLCEDALEAFFGATEHLLDINIRNGVGGAICYDILASFLDEMVFETTYDKLLDNITRLKELGDAHPLFRNVPIKQIKYENKGHRKVDQFTVIVTVQASLVLMNDQIVPMAMGAGAEEQEAKANAALQVLQALNAVGIRKYSDFSEPKAVFKI